MIVFDLYRQFLVQSSADAVGSGRPSHLSRYVQDRSTQDRKSELMRHVERRAPPDAARPLQSVYAIGGKRAFDIVLAILMLPIVAMILLCVLPLVLGDGGPVFYRHPRVGRGGKMFDCLKIRTMRIDSAKLLTDLLKSDPVAAHEWAETQKLRSDPRVTRFGLILRKTSIDELPQLWNVIRGDMSLVGPRPVTLSEIERYGEARKDYTSVRPGITGLWQIAPSRYDMTYEERVAVDSSYAKTVSFSGDVRILWGTLLWATNPNGI